jgi:hypothetical protein
VINIEEKNTGPQCVKEQSLELQSSLYLLFVDYQRALNPLNRAWISVEQMVRGLPSKFINIIREGYEDFCCRVLHEGQLSDPIKTPSGV